MIHLGKQSILTRSAMTMLTLRPIIISYVIGQQDTISIYTHTHTHKHTHTHTHKYTHINAQVFTPVMKRSESL